jgi:hypothetical protein
VKKKNSSCEEKNSLFGRTTIIGPSFLKIYTKNFFHSRASWNLQGFMGMYPFMGTRVPNSIFGWSYGGGSKNGSAFRQELGPTDFREKVRAG